MKFPAHLKPLASNISMFSSTQSSSEGESSRERGAISLCSWITVDVIILRRKGCVVGVRNSGGGVDSTTSITHKGASFSPLEIELLVAAVLVEYPQVLISVILGEDEA